MFLGFSKFLLPVVVFSYMCLTTCPHYCLRSVLHPVKICLEHAIGNFSTFAGYGQAWHDLNSACFVCFDGPAGGFGAPGGGFLVLVEVVDCHHFFFH